MLHRPADAPKLLINESAPEGGILRLWLVITVVPPRARRYMHALAWMLVSSIVLSGLLNGLRGDTTCHPSASINYGISVRGEGVIQYDERKRKRTTDMPVLNHSQWWQSRDHIKRKLPRVASAAINIYPPRHNATFYGHLKSNPTCVVT
ncbi:hypothetical protein EV421DRAFT_1904040 [Armillaria borealis]|uniref:Uncharacterized protein n=1 Tax=Armillaria borealis TaxID=47425 RepID=A0AA39JJR3_9AGAR|nr:hypothetical protein EV421DRAFT_1904040 [Armillaria borealis]